MLNVYILIFCVTKGLCSSTRCSCCARALAKNTQ